MTADTGIMRICSSAYQRCISMTGATLRSGHGHNTCMVKRGCRMQRFPRSSMTGGTVTANTKGLTNGGEDKSTIRIMTAGTGGMRICSTAYQGIIMAAGTCRRTNRYKRSMIRRWLRMERRKVSTVTRVTVTRRRLANGNADPGAGCGIMTADTRVMRICCSAYQRGISMAVSTLSTRSGHDAGMIRRRRQMCCFPRTRMTDGTVAANSKGLTDC